MFFWIVARANNCHYCLGHQESGLARAGLSDDEIAGLRKHFQDKEVAELVHRITLAAFFDRLTETAGLRLESNGVSESR
jgi:alkylhydroperoxidase family enzyme